MLIFDRYLAYDTILRYIAREKISNLDGNY